MKASIRNRMVPQAPRKQWLACRDQWIKGDARPDSACRFHFSARLCPIVTIVEMRWLSQTGHFDCRKNMQKNMRKDWIWRYSMFWKRLGFAVLFCSAGSKSMLAWFDRYLWSLTKAQEEAAAKSNGWILGITVRHPLEGPGGFNEFGVWAIRHHTAIACHSQIRILGITSGQIWLRLRLRFFRICGDPWSWKAGIMLYPRCIQMFLSGRVHIQSFLWKNKRTLQHFAGCKRMRYEFLPKAVGHIYI